VSIANKNGMNTFRLTASTIFAIFIGYLLFLCFDVRSIMAYSQRKLACRGTCPMGAISRPGVYIDTYNTKCQT
jgi:hypothetical protein